MGGRKAVRMTTGEVQEFLDTHLRAHVATLNRDGTIHLVPVHFARSARRSCSGPIPPPRRR